MTPPFSRGWLQRHRVELNAMTTPQFIGWLDDKMAAFGNGKLVPPAAVLESDLGGVLEDRLERQITEQILREARIEDKVAEALRKMELPNAEALYAVVEHALTDQPASSWRAAVSRVADDVLAAQVSEGGSPESGP